VKRLIPAFCCLIAAAPIFAEVQKQPIADLIQTGNRKEALARIKAGGDVNEAQPDGTRPVHWAVYQVDYEVLDALLAKKAKVNVKNEFGSTPIAEAAKLGDARMVKALLDAGAEPEGANQDGETALMLAIKTGELPAVELLIKAGAKVNTIEQFHKQTPLMWAASAPKNAPAMVKLLLAKDADVKPRALYSDWDSQISSEPRAQYRPVGGLTAMLYAVRDGCDECVEELIAAGADVNLPTPEGVTALMLAIDNEHNDVAKLLLDHGANPNLWDWWGRTALYIAVDRRANEVTPVRGVTGAIIGGRGGRGRGEPGAAASPGPRVSTMEIIKALLAAGVNVDPQLNMHRPSRGGNSGRFIEEFQNTGCTPLMRAAIAGDTETAQVLLDKGANPNIVAMGLTPFLVAAGVGTGGRGTGLAASTTAGGAGNVALMNALLQHGADINIQVTGTKTYTMRISRAPSSNEGMTALHVAAQAGRTEEVKYLLDKGARTDIQDINGHKPVDVIGSAAVGRDGQPAAGAAGNGAAAAASTTSIAPPAGAGTRGGNGRANEASAAEIRALLQNAGTK
jgi:ankyrin repeat protein